MAMQQQIPQGLQALMPQQRPVQPPRPAMPNVDPQRMQAAVDVVDNDLQDLGVDPKTRAAMKAQEAVDLLKSADQDLAKAQGQQVPQIPVIDQRKQQAAEGIISLMQRLMPGAQVAGMQRSPQPQRRAAPNMLAGLGGMQRRPQPQARQQRPMAAGIPQLPAPNMARMPQMAARGGIIGYAEGGPTEGKTAQVQQLDPFNNLMSEEYNELANDLNVKNYMSIEQQVERYKAAGDMESARMESENLKTFPADTIIKVQRLKTLIAGGDPDAELAYGGEVKKYAGPDGSEVELDPEQRAVYEAILAERPEEEAPKGPTFTPPEEKRAQLAEREERRRARIRERNEEFNLRVQLADQGFNSQEIDRILQGTPAAEAAAPAQPETPRGVPLDLSKPPSRTATRGTDLEDSGIVANLFTPQQGARQPAPTTPTDPAQDIIGRMRTEAANIGSYQRTPSTLETQLEEVLGEQLGAMEGARAEEEAAARAALGMSDVEKKAVEDLIKADEAYYGTILSPRERAKRQNELIAQAYMSGNSLVDQARRSSAAQSQLRRQQQQQEREAAKVRPQATVELEKAQRDIRGQVYQAGREGEQNARTTLNQAIQSAGNYVNTIANRDAEMAIQQSRANLDVLKAEIDSVLTARQLDDAAEGRLMTLYANLDRNIMDLDDLLVKMEADPLAKADDKTKVRNYVTELKGIKQKTINDVARQIGLPEQRVNKILGAGAGEGSTGDPEIDRLLELY